MADFQDNRFQEIWKEFPHNTDIELSSWGNVRLADGSLPLIKKLRSGYLTIQICNENLQKGYYHIHRIIAITFLGERQPDMVVHHKDYNKINNNISNLEYVHKNQHQKKHCGSCHGKLKENEINEIRSLYKSGYPINKISKIFNVTAVQIGNIVKYRSWKHLID